MLFRSLIDEVDQSSNNQLFVLFLAMLRNKYLQRSRYKTFHSIVLAGVHDVKTLKLKLRPDEERKLNSPWNIATKFKVDMNLQPSEIKPMLDDYCEETGVKMDTKSIADCLFSAACKFISTLNFAAMFHGELSFLSSSGRNLSFNVLTSWTPAKTME